MKNLDIVLKFLSNDSAETFACKVILNYPSQQTNLKKEDLKMSARFRQNTNAIRQKL
ncbi:MAG TPA: hypothetical protein VGI82_03805 [Chitinophagaceae bacterium]